jgi:single-strand DNA-binding protein
VNRIFLIGRLTRDPELRYVPSGQPVANFTLAVDRSFKNSQGERDTDFVDIVAWRKSAELATQHLSKGRLVAVEGRLQIRSYEAQDGSRRKVAEVVTDRIQFLDRKNGTSARAEESGPIEDEPAPDGEPAEVMA